jgi:hypothetical protein
MPLIPGPGTGVNTTALPGNRDLTQNQTLRSQTLKADVRADAAACRRRRLRVDCRSTKGEKSEARKHEKEEKTRKRHPDIFYDFVLSEISPAQLNPLTFNRGVFVILLCARQVYPVRGAARDIVIQYSLAFLKLKSSPEGEGFSPIPQGGQLWLAKDYFSMYRCRQ